MAEKPMGLISPEIEKLNEKLQKDPTSKVFFNLAEEYYKGGLLEEAMSVLQSGLKSHPTYLSAKVLLGKVYSDQHKNHEAREIFEQILKINPDNIVANKKLALIYFDEKLLKEAENCCNQILFFNSKDVDALNLLLKIKDIKKTAQNPPPEEKGTPVVSIQKPEVQTGRLEVLEKIEQPAEQIMPSQPIPEEQKSEQKEEPVLHPISPEGEILHRASPQLMTPSKPALPPPPDTSDIKLPEGSVSSGQEKGFDFSDLMKAEELRPPQPVLDAQKGSFPDQKQSENGKGVSKENLDTMALAELYIKQGHYDKGVEIYQKLLDQDPYNETVRQQLEDAKTIGNLLGLKSKPHKIEENILETIIPSAELPSDQPMAPAAHVLSPEKQAKIERLKQWLENLKKAH